jgi:hypothetical protein
MLCEFIGTILSIFGNYIMSLESSIFQRYDYINHIYNSIEYIESIIPSLNKVRPPSFRYSPANIRNCKTSAGKILCSYSARKRHLWRQQVVISGSNLSKNDNDKAKSTYTHPSFHPMESYVYNLYPLDDPSCQDNT